MNELERIAREAEILSASATPFLLATVVRVSGSSYRRPGARMLVAGERWVAGCVSGGCLEGDVMLRGAHRCRDGAAIVTYDSTSDEGASWGIGLGCHGVVDVLLEHVAAGDRHDGLAFARACFADEASGVLVTVIASDRPGVAIGSRIAVGPPSPLALPVADAEVASALEQLAAGPPGVVVSTDLGITALVEIIAPSPQLFVLGSSHDAAPLVALATSIGFRVTVADTAIREPSRFLGAHRQLSTGGDLTRLAAAIDDAAVSYVVIKHHQLAADRDALALALASRARYIGVLGPARRTRDLLAELGRGPDDDPRVHGPIGLDIGAETPEQIAVAIVAELQAVARRLPAGKLRTRTRPLHVDVACAVLAAGGSRRLGRPKQLVEIDGSPLVRRAASTCLAAQIGPVGVVLGADREAVADALGDLRVAQVANPQWDEGIASSIRAAVRWAETTGAGALVITLADQPLLTAAHVAALRDAWLAGAPAAGSRFSGVVGAPALFDRARWPELLQLAGDQGAGRLLRDGDRVAIDWAAGAVDVDTDDDIHALMASARTGARA